jgi:protein-S-isoprenylcysteine O-methyltransferase Ste14
MPLMVRVEERELLDRLGEPYAAYLRRVPRFFL